MIKKRYQYRKWLFAAVVLVAIIALAPKLMSLTPEKIIAYTPASPILAAAVLIGIYCAKSVLMVIPTYGLYLVAGMLFAPGWGILVGYLGLACELSLGFLIGQWLGRKKADALINKHAKAKQFVGFLDSNSQMVCFITRLLPMPYPVDLGSIYFGASGMSYIRHLLFSLLGFSGIMVPLTLAGSAIDDPLSVRFLLPFGISLVLCIALFIAFQLWNRKMRHKAEVPPEEQ